MQAYYKDSFISLHNMDCIEGMAQMEPESVQCVVTSPPYWGLRTYVGMQERVWGDGVFCAFGHEPTIEGYVGHTVEVLQVVKKLLRRDGVVFWNIGDSASSGGRKDYHSDKLQFGAPTRTPLNFRPGLSMGIKPKDLCLIPFRVALAIQADGWYVRSVIVWSKPNSKPESVLDRPTKAYEFVLMLTKSKRYFWDWVGAKEPSSEPNRQRHDRVKKLQHNTV